MELGLLFTLFADVLADAKTRGSSLRTNVRLSLSPWPMESRYPGYICADTQGDFAGTEDCCVQYTDAIAVLNWNEAQCMGTVRNVVVRCG